MQIGHEYAYLKIVQNYKFWTRIYLPVFSDEIVFQRKPWVLALG